MMISAKDEELITEGYMYIDKYGKKCLSHEESPEKHHRISNFESFENAVMVLGYAKSGSHLCMSILDALGRCYHKSPKLNWMIFFLNISN